MSLAYAVGQGFSPVYSPPMAWQGFGLRSPSDDPTRKPCATFSAPCNQAKIFCDILVIPSTDSDGRYPALKAATILTMSSPNRFTLALP